MSALLRAGAAAGSGRAPEPPLGEWVETLSHALTTNSTGWNGFTIRQVIPGGAVVDGTKVRFRFTTRVSAAMVIAKAYVGAQAASGDPYDFAATPVQLMFGGSPGISMGASQSVWSDDATLDTDDGVPLILSVFFNGVTTISYIETGSVNYYWRDGDHAATVDATGHTASSTPRIAMIDRVEIWVPD